MTAPLRITIVQGAFLPIPPLQGGAVEKAWYALGREFAARGHVVTHVGRSYPGLADEEQDAGVLYRRVAGFETPAQLWKLKLLDLRYSLRARVVLPPADILVTNTFWLPVIERRRSRGRVYVHVARYPKGQLRFYPRRALLQTVSAPVRDAILAEVPKRREQVRVLPYPLAPAYLVERNANPTRTVLYAGRIHPEKGLELLIEGFRRFRDAPPGAGWRLRLVGPHAVSQGGGGDGFRQRLLAAAQGLDVEISGPEFSEERLVAAYRDAAIFVYPSLAERGETFGLAVLEAMAAGAVPVVSALACFRDFVIAEKNGRVFDHRSSDPAGALAHELHELAARPAELTALSAAAWQTARDYSLAVVADRYLNDFATVGSE